MGNLCGSRSTTSPCLAAAPLILKATMIWLQVLLPAAIAGTREATQFSVPSGSPDEYVQAGAEFARELDPNVEISYRDSQSGSLSVSRVEGSSIKCIVPVSSNTREALKPLARFLNDPLHPQAQAMFSLAPTIG